MINDYWNKLEKKIIFWYFRLTTKIVSDLAEGGNIEMSEPTENLV